MENCNWEKMASHLTGETNAPKEIENQEILKQSEEMLRKIDTHYQAEKIDTKKAWQAVENRIKTTPTIGIKHKKTRVKLYKYAAILVVCLLLAPIAYHFGFKAYNAKMHQQVVSSQNELVKDFILPDGSLVTLNRNSKLLFPKKFKENTREVSITGEAFFDVKHNPEKPFIIHAGSTQVKVLGTSFNVAAYPNLKAVEVTVKTGKVEVSTVEVNTSTKKEAIFLLPGEKGTFLAEKQLLKKSVNQNPNFIAWKTHKLVFNSLPLHEVVKCLEESYHTKIEITDPALNNLVYEGRFDEKPIEFVLNVICLSFNLKLLTENGHYKLAKSTTKN